MPLRNTGRFMDAEIVAIGDEIASGQLLDTNTQWLSQRLEELGIRVLYHTTVGDEIEAIAGVFRQAIGRADVVVVTGGLGPTADDLTREAIAEATGQPLVLDPEALKVLHKFFARYRRKMPEQNRRQAMFPAGSRAIPNPHGTAPGIAVEVAKTGSAPCRLFALPGVPPEMVEMWGLTVSPELRQAVPGRRVVKHRKIKCFGAGESQIEAMLPDLIRRGRTPRVGINASKTTIILRITAEGTTEEACDAAMEPTVATIRRCLGKLVFGEGEEELQHAVGRLLRQKGKTLATAEWGTGGMVADWMHEARESQGHYLGGIVVTGPESLDRALALPTELIRRHAPQSRDLVGAMAAGCRERFGADFGLAVGPFPHFDPAAAEPESVFFALASAAGVHVKSSPFAGLPATLKILCAKRALNLVRLAMSDATEDA